MLFFHRHHALRLENIYEEIIADKKIWNIRFMETYHLIKEIMSGKISFCKIKSDHDKLLKVDRGIDNRKVSFMNIKRLQAVHLIIRILVFIEEL